jgi:hypothetical protein
MPFRRKPRWVLEKGGIFLQQVQGNALLTKCNHTLYNRADVEPALLYLNATLKVQVRPAAVGRAVGHPWTARRAFRSFKMAFGEVSLTDALSVIRSYLSGAAADRRRGLEIVSSGTRGFNRLAGFWQKRMHACTDVLVDDLARATAPTRTRRCRKSSRHSRCRPVRCDSVRPAYVSIAINAIPRIQKRIAVRPIDPLMGANSFMAVSRPNLATIDGDATFGTVQRQLIGMRFSMCRTEARAI